MEDKIFPIKDFSISLGVGTELVRLVFVYDGNPPIPMPFLMHLDIIRRLHKDIGLFLQEVAKHPGITNQQDTLQ